MIKFLGTNKIKTAVFISGNGSNLKNLIEFSLFKKLPIKISFIVSSNSNSKGLNFAKKYKIKSQIYKFNNKTKDENEILKYLKRNNISMICLAGFMKILSNNFIKKYSGTILNIHPSLLPKYRGLNTHRRAIENKEKFSGCTVHFVNSKLDSGKVVLQKRVKITNKDTPKSLSKKILKLEHFLYPKAILKVISNF